MAFHYKQCTIQYAARTDGTPAQGYVEFKPNSVLVDSDTGLILNDQTIDAYLDADGKVTVSLLACDSPGITPADWSWNIEEKIDGGSQWWFQIFDTMEEPINLKDLYIPGEAPPTIAVQGPKGDPGDKGDKGDTGDQGEQGPAGQAAVIIGEFTRDPLELPPDGFLPADWDSPGKPAQDHQTVIGQAIHYTPDGHLWSYVGQELLAAGWQDVGLIVGATGPQGPPGPLGPEDIIGGTGITVTENEANGTVTISSSGVADHGQLTGLGDDDHTQYHNNTRGDARYDSKGTATAAVNAHVAAVDPHTQYLTADDVIPPEIGIQNDEPTEETITLWIDPDAPDYSGVGLSDLDARFVNIDGDTMTGNLKLDPGAVAFVEAGYSPTAVAASSGRLTVRDLDNWGTLRRIQLANPVNADEAATKSYVDAIGVWQNWTPVVRQGANTISGTNYSSRYCRIGDTIFFEIVFVPTTVGVAGAAIIVDPPVPIGDAKGGGFPLGQFNVRAGSSNTRYAAWAYRQAGADLGFIMQNMDTGNNITDQIAATGNEIRGSGSYEA